MKRNSLFLNIILIIIFTTLPFLEFISFNLNTINLREELVLNYLTIKRLLILYIIFNFILISFLIVQNFRKKNLYNTSIYLLSVYWLLFNYNDLKKIIEKISGLNFFTDLSKYDGYISITIIITLSIFLVKT